MNRQQYSPATLTRLHDEARERALELRREAIDAAFAQLAAAVRRWLAALRVRPGFNAHVEA
jgi:hypothetical protein